MTILLIDDDTELNQLTADYLRSKKFTVEQAYDGKSGLKMLEDALDETRVVLLDIMMPGMDGYEVLKKLRQLTAIPVIMLTARGDDIDKILGLEMGADDYLAKPFNPRELEARIKAVLRRVELDSQYENKDTRPARLSFDVFELDAEAYSFYCDGQLIELTNTEFDIMRFFLKNPERLIEKSELSLKVLEKDLGNFDRSLDMHISNLRKKLSYDATKKHGDKIATVRGKGYRLSVQ